MHKLTTSAPQSTIRQDVPIVQCLPSTDSQHPCRLRTPARKSHRLRRLKHTAGANKKSKFRGCRRPMWIVADQYIAPTPTLAHKMLACYGGYDIEWWFGRSFMTLWPMIDVRIIQRALLSYKEVRNSFAHWRGWYEISIPLWTKPSVKLLKSSTFSMAWDL